MQAMVLAAGKGTRLKPLTDIIPKALVPVADKPLIQIVLDRLAEADVNSVVINVHHHAAQIKNFIGLASHSYKFNISVSDESRELLETGGAIKKARSLFDVQEPVLIHNVDILSNVDISDFYQQSLPNDATLLVSSRKTKRYLLFNEDMQLVGWTNIETGEVKSPYPNVQELAKYQFAFSGIHCFSPTLFPRMEQWPDCFSIIDFYLQTCAQANIKGVVKEDLKLLDVGKLDTLQTLQKTVKDNLSNWINFN